MAYCYSARKLTLLNVCSALQSTSFIASETLVPVWLVESGMSFSQICSCAPWNRRAPWKNRTRSTTMKLRKSLVKPVTRQKTCNYIESSCSVLPPEIVMHDDAFNVILWTSADICVVHDDLGWKNQTTRYNCRFSAMSLALRVIFVRRKRPPIYASCMTISGGRTEQNVIIGFGELAAVD